MKLDALLNLLALLRALQFSHLTSHWQVRGLPFFGDHRMFERLYAAVGEEIDALAEKIVGDFGPEAVEPVAQAAKMAAVLADCAHTTPVERALMLEDKLQAKLRHLYHELKERGDMSLGLDDYLMATANADESALYLLRQRLRALSSAMVQGPVEE